MRSRSGGGEGSGGGARFREEGALQEGLRVTNEVTDGEVRSAGVVGVSGHLPRTVRPKRPCLFRGRPYGLSEPRSPKLLCVAPAGVILQRTLSSQLLGPGLGSGEPQALLPYLDSDGQYVTFMVPLPQARASSPLLRAGGTRCSLAGIA